MPYTGVMAESNDLQKFREEWKRELSVSQHESSEKSAEKGNRDRENAPEVSAGVVLQRATSSQKLYIEEVQEPPTDPCDHEEQPEQNDQDEQTYYPFMILGKLLRDGSREKRDSRKPQENNLSRVQSTKRKYFDDEQSGETKCTKNIPLKKKHCDLNNSECQKDPHLQKNIHLSNKLKADSSSERFLDIFIADLDEINEIPFFDVTLPKEVAVHIFKHLSLTDLCHCAQVSKSWKSLADDQLLWCQICHRLGYEQDLQAVDKNNWKHVVRRHIVHHKTLVANWKGRIGKLSQLQHPQGGVLTAVSSCHHTVVAGYNNGDVKIWDIVRGDNCVFQPSSTALQIDETIDEGTISNYVLHVETSPHITVASYNHRHVDIWWNDDSLKPAGTFQCEGGWGISALKLAKLSPLFALSQGYYVQIYKGSREMPFAMTDKLDLNKMVCGIRWLEPRSHQFHTDSVLAVATTNIINIYNPEKGAGHLREIHNMIDSPVTCFDLTSDPYQMGVASGMFGGPTEAFKIYLYDLTSGRLLTSLLGHTWMTTCLNMADSPSNTLVTGCGDRKVRVYDTRKSSWPSMTLVGHCGKITTVQMDDWKVVSGDEGGFVRVWDQRMRAKLWEWHNRHPVQYSRFSEGLLVVGNVPIDKFPVVDNHFDRIPNTRYRGSVQVYDFSVDQTTQGVPEICLSSYDQPETYNYNIRLAVPYDTV